MRAEFKSLLGRLEHAYRRLDTLLSKRYASAPVPYARQVSEPDSYEEAVTRFFWALYCPELDIDRHFDTHRQTVLNAAFKLLKRDFGPNARARTFDLARTGVAEGLSGVLRALRECLLEDWDSCESKGRVDEYRTSTEPRIMFLDAQAYILAYRWALPGEMLGENGVVVMERFTDFLAQHGRMVHDLRRQARK